VSPARLDVGSTVTVPADGTTPLPAALTKYPRNRGIPFIWTAPQLGRTRLDRPILVASPEVVCELVVDELGVVM
jgi:hypothetical protein